MLYPRACPGHVQRIDRTVRQRRLVEQGKDARRYGFDALAGRFVKISPIRKAFTAMRDGTSRDSICRLTGLENALLSSIQRRGGVIDLEKRIFRCLGGHR